MNSKKPKELWVGWPDGENAMIYDEPLPGCRKYIDKVYYDKLLKKIKCLREESLELNNEIISLLDDKDALGIEIDLLTDKPSKRYPSR